VKRATLLYLVAALALGQGSLAQTPAPATPPPSSSTESRPDASYPKPSGQDSQPKQTPTKSKATPPQATTGVESRGSQTAQQSSAVKPVAKQKAYTGNTGKKQDPGTACSTARPTKNGGIDCGTGGEGATPGKVPK
jgi:hypothetical protein